MGKVVIRDDLELILFSPGANVSADSIKDYLIRIGKHTKDISGYKRYADFNRIISTEFTYTDFKDIASAIKKFRGYKSEAKACFYCRDLGIKRMATAFFEKMKPEFMNYYASMDIEACAKYLNVDVQILSSF